MSLSPVFVVGIPFDLHSSYLRGAAEAPARIREAFFCPSSNLWTEDGRDLGGGQDRQWRFTDDLEVTRIEYLGIEQEIAVLLEGGARIIALGGDHSVTYPLVKAHGRHYPALNILHFDAHPDLYQELDGNRHSHACPFARIMEERAATRLVQVGIRTMTGHQREQARRFGVEVIEMHSIDRAQDLVFNGPLYISIDLDCLDPAFAPGVSHHEPGGMSTREILQVLSKVQGRVVGADIVEYNPLRDLQGVTGMVAVKLLKELLAKMLG